MASDLKKKFAARLKQVIAGRPIIDLVQQGGPSRSYIYRMLSGGANVSVEQLDAVLRAYGSTLAEFFEPWKAEAQMQRQQQAADIRIRMERVLASDADLTGLSEFLRMADPGESRTPGKRR